MSRLKPKQGFHSGVGCIQIKFEATMCQKLEFLKIVLQECKRLGGLNHVDWAKVSDKISKDEEYAWYFGKQTKKFRKYYSYLRKQFEENCLPSYIVPTSDNLKLWKKCVKICKQIEDTSNLPFNPQEMQVQKLIRFTRNWHFGLTYIFSLIRTKDYIYETKEFITF
jgi:hypothetical protein